MEKAREIKVKADEEFAIEKVSNRTSPILKQTHRYVQAKLVKHEQQAIDAQYEKKRKGAETAQKMYVSGHLRPRTSTLTPLPAHSRRSRTNRV
jgi:hypothetical protein